MHDPGFALAQAEFQIGRVRKLGRGAEAAMARIEIRPQVLQQRAHRHVAELRTAHAARGKRPRESDSDLLILLADLGALVSPDFIDARQQFGESGQSIARGLGKIRAAEERRAIGRKEHGERPAAGTAREHLVGRLIDLVEVGPFFAVHFDVDEVAVHQRRDLHVFEALVRHHMAPVAGGVADREQDRLVFALRPL